MNRPLPNKSIPNNFLQSLAAEKHLPRQTLRIESDQHRVLLNHNTPFKPFHYSDRKSETSPTKKSTTMRRSRWCSIGSQQSPSRLATSTSLRPKSSSQVLTDAATLAVIRQTLPPSPPRRKTSSQDVLYVLREPAIRARDDLERC